LVLALREALVAAALDLREREVLQTLGVIGSEDPVDAPVPARFLRHGTSFHELSGPEGIVPVTGSKGLKD
jgi:hypothetical protein